MSLLAIGGLAWFALALVVGLIVGPMLGALGNQPGQEVATPLPRRAVARRSEAGNRRAATERVS
jgi:hypothetical protein